jgi:hypothetical protein
MNEAKFGVQKEWVLYQQEPKPNEIESMVEHQLTRIEQQISLLRKSLLVSRKQPNGQAWLQMASDLRELLGIYTKLEMVNINIRCAVERTNPHEGVDG